jgi:hypothetical protein
MGLKSMFDRMLGRSSGTSGGPEQAPATGGSMPPAPSEAPAAEASGGGSHGSAGATPVVAPPESAPPGQAPAPPADAPSGEAAPQSPPAS